MDFWDGEELHLKIDDKPIYKFYPKTRTENFLDLGGNFTYDRKERFSILFRHVDPYLKFELVPYSSTVFNQLERSFGIRQLILDLQVQCQANSERINTTSCACNIGFYKKERVPCLKKGYQNNFCFDCVVCPLFCKVCEAPNKCIQCISGMENNAGKCDAPNGKKKNSIDIFHYSLN